MRTMPSRPHRPARPAETRYMQTRKSTKCARARVAKPADGDYGFTLGGPLRLGGIPMGSTGPTSRLDVRSPSVLDLRGVGTSVYYEDGDVLEKFGGSLLKRFVGCRRGVDKRQRSKRRLSA